MRTTWSWEVGGYSVRCGIREHGSNVHTVIVEENGRELERHTMITAPHQQRSPFELAIKLYSKHYDRIINAVHNADRHRRHH